MNDFEFAGTPMIPIAIPDPAKLKAEVITLMAVIEPEIQAAAEGDPLKPKNQQTAKIVEIAKRMSREAIKESA